MLCRTYWYPVYTYVRRRGHEPCEAEDLTQEFFGRLVSKRYLQRVNREKGKFRSYLLGAIRHFLADEWDRRHTLKRGGNFTFISWERETLERRYSQELSHQLTPEKLFDRSWAFTLLEKVMRQLESQYAAAGKSDLFNTLRHCLIGEKGRASYTQLALTLGTTEGGVKMAVLRMRERYGELLRQAVAGTVAGPFEVEAELRYLFGTIG
jgi:RNA polymerase sigma-70 factor (ECF subfamily)